MAITTYWATDTKEVVVSVVDGGEPCWNYLPVIGDASSMGDHVAPGVKEASASPLPKEAWDEYVRSLPVPAPPEPPTAIEKLQAAGLTVEELKALLAS
jgi:hypothetical protein